MNIAVLSKCRVRFGRGIKLVEETRYLTRRGLIPDQTYHAFYLSTRSPQEIFHLSTWKQMPADSELYKSSIFRELEILERENFRLLKDFQLFSSPATHSHLRLMTFPANCQTEYYRQRVTQFFQTRHEFLGMVGGWTGYSLDNEYRFLNRVEWDSLEAQEAFFKSQPVRQALVQRQQEGIELEYASFDLSALPLSYLNYSPVELAALAG